MLKLEILVLMALALTACGGGEPRWQGCEWPTETARPLDLSRAADQAHLRRDAESAETIAIHYADVVAPARQEGWEAYGQTRNQCMAFLFGTVSRIHAVDIALVRAYATRRNDSFDVMVLVSFAVVYAFGAYVLAGFVTHRFAVDEWRAATVAVTILSLGAAMAALMAFHVWAGLAESLRLGSGHLSYRAERLPLHQQRISLFAAGVGLFWLISVLRYLQAIRRRQLL